MHVPVCEFDLRFLSLFGVSVKMYMFAMYGVADIFRDELKTMGRVTTHLSSFTPDKLHIHIHIFV